MRRPLAAPLALVLVLAAGCGAAANDDAADLTGQDKEAADKVVELRDAAREDDAAEICRDIFAAELRERLGGDCEARVDQAFEDADTKQFDVESVRVTGQTARVRIASGDQAGEEDDLVELVREGDEWRIAGIAAAPDDN